MPLSFAQYNPVHHRRIGCSRRYLRSVGVPDSLAAPLRIELRPAVRTWHQPHLGYVRRAGGIAGSRLAMKRRTNFCAQLSSSRWRSRGSIVCNHLLGVSIFLRHLDTFENGVSVSISP